MKGRLWVLGVCLAAVVLVAGCSHQAAAPQAPTSQAGGPSPQTVQATPSPTATPTPRATLPPDLTKMVLDVNDLPKGWELASRGERSVSDVSDFALDLGWRGGYYTTFQKRLEGQLSVVLAEIGNYVSFYPPENISKVFEKPTGSGREPLSNPSIGERSQASKEKVNTVLGEVVNYRIEIIKNGVYVTLDGSGNIDYELLKDLARKASQKPLRLPDPLPPPPSPRAKTSSTSSPAPTPSKEYRVGETATDNRLSVTLNQVSYANKIGEYSTPKEGSQYAIIDITVKNAGTAQTYVSSSNVALKDSEGFTYNSAYVSGLSQEFKGQNLVPGDTARGNMAFEVPTKASGLKLIFTQEDYPDSSRFVFLVS